MKELKQKLLISVFVIYVINVGAVAQNLNGSYRFVFYNAENYFDCFDDSIKNDKDFLPDANRHWTSSKVYNKTQNLFKVFTAIGAWDAPVLIGLAEIENAYVLRKLTKYSKLAAFNYNYIHFESPDSRGIDVALLYRYEKFEVLYSQNIGIVFPFDANLKTRDILYVKGIVDHLDTLHVFINHWPSRMGGKEKSEPKRIFVAQQLRLKVDSILEINPVAKIIIAGDLNDEPEDISVTEHLKAKNITPENTGLINLSKLNEKHMGTHKYGGRWSILDHIIVSNSLLNDTIQGLKISERAYQIFDAPFLLTEDKNYMGFKPNRTFNGFKYQNGFSDHLPVYIDLISSDTIPNP